MKGEISNFQQELGAHSRTGASFGLSEGEAGPGPTGRPNPFTFVVKISIF